MITRGPECLSWEDVSRGHSACESRQPLSELVRENITVGSAHLCLLTSFLATISQCKVVLNIYL